jgi:hypothetical protein
VQDPTNSNIVGKLSAFKYAFGTSLSADEVRIALETASDVTFSYFGEKPYMLCSYYDATGERFDARCTTANPAECARPGGAT